MVDMHTSSTVSDIKANWCLVGSTKNYVVTWICACMFMNIVKQDHQEHEPRNMACWWRVVGFFVCKMTCHCAFDDLDWVHQNVVVLFGIEKVICNHVFVCIWALLHVCACSCGYMRVQVHAQSCIMWVCLYFMCEMLRVLVLVFSMCLHMCVFSVNV